MLFEEAAFEKNMDAYAAAGDRDGLRDYLAAEFQKLKGERPVLAGGCGCDGKSACRGMEEEALWQRNRLQGQLAVGTPLARLYCEEQRWTECFEVYTVQEQSLRAAGLARTELFGRVLLNRAYASMEQGDAPSALALGERAEGLFRRGGGEDRPTLALLYQLLAAAYDGTGDGEKAAHATEMARTFA